MKIIQQIQEQLKSIYVFIAFGIIGVFILTPSGALFSSEVLISNDTEEILLEPHITVLADKTGKLTFGELIKDQQSQAPQYKFDQAPPQNMNFGLTDHAYWFKFKINPKSNLEQNLYYIDFGYHAIDYINLYVPDAKGNYKEYKGGDHYLFNEREVRNTNVAMPIRVKETGGKDIYVRVTTTGSLSVPIRLYTPRRLMAVNIDSMFVNGIWLGLMLVIILYNFFVYLATKDMSYFYYVIYVIGVTGFQAVLNGIGFMYFWPEQVWWAHSAASAGMGISMIFGSKFTEHFLQTKQRFPVVQKMLYAAMGAGTILFVGSFLLPHFILAKMLAVFGFLFLIMVSTAGVNAFIKKYRSARWFLIAFSGFVTLNLLGLLAKVQVIPMNYIFENAFQMGSAVEVILLSFALADRIKIMKDEKEEAQKHALELQTKLADSYARFVPRELLRNLGKQSIFDVSLGDQVEKKMTVLFADIRQFTNLSEKMTPEENFNFINSYLSRMSPLIQSNNGFIDKFMGDGIMALFEASVDNAVEAAVRMQELLIEYNMNRQKNGYIPIKVGIGIHSGSLMMGIIGSNNRMEGTVISDSVNLASRIETSTKTYKANIAISEDTMNMMKNKDQYKFRFLDHVTVKGKTGTITIYEILDGDAPDIRNKKIESIAIFEEGVQHYFKNKHSEAKKSFAKVLEIHPDDHVAQLYVHRINEAAAETA